MIGRKEWFTYRVMGWGIAPRTWQGWVYVGVFLAIFGIAAVLPVSESVRMWLMSAIAGFLMLDAIHIMTQLGSVHDERERLHQLIIERNCSFTAVAALVAVAAFQAFFRQADIPGKAPFDVSLLIVLGAMAVAKILSTIYVRRQL